MKDINLYGIPNCDTVKKSIAWLKKNNIEFNFHDYKKEGITATKLNAWLKIINWQILINKKGTTWKKIPPGIQETIINQKTAVKLMQENTSLIKRPVIEINGTILTGYNEDVYKDIFLSA